MFVLSNFFNNDMFHFKHIMLMLVSFALIVVCSILAIKRDLKIKTAHRILLFVGIISESLKVITYILMNESELGGYLPKTDLPFHLCSIQLIFILILNLSHNEKLNHLLHSFMLPTCLFGGILAIIIATSSARSNWIITIQYFMYHAAISTFSIYLLGKKDIKFTVKDYANTIIMLVGVFFIAIYINSILYTKTYVLDPVSGELTEKYMEINFMYVVNPPQSGLPFLTKKYGWGVYITHYTLLSIFCVTCVYAKPIIEAIKNKKHKTEATINE